jgi:hypothetical protein
MLENNQNPGDSSCDNSLPNHLSLLYEIFDHYVEPLRNASRYLMRDFVISPALTAYIELSSKQGVYLIESPQGSPIYIGRTHDGVKEKGLADRIYTHAKGRDSNALDLLRKVRNDPTLPNSYFQDHYVRVLVINYPPLRYGIEYHCTKVLKPEAKPVPSS